MRHNIHMKIINELANAVLLGLMVYAVLSAGGIILSIIAN